MLVFFRSAWLLFALVFIVNLLTGVTFILGTNASVVCHSLSNLKLIEKVSLELVWYFVYTK